MSAVTPFSDEEVGRYLHDAEVAAQALAAADAIRTKTVERLPGPGAPGELRRKAAFACSVQGLSPRLAALGGQGSLAPELKLHLEEEAARSRARGQRILLLLDRIRGLLQEAGIRPIPLKGAALLLRGEIPPGMRPMADLDLLLREDEVLPAARILEAALGYRALWNTRRHLVLAERDESVPLPACEHPGNPLRIELHRSFRLEVLGIVLDATPDLRGGIEEAGGWRLPSAGVLLDHLLFHAAEDFAAKGLRGAQAADFAVLRERRGPLPLPDLSACRRAPVLYAVDALERLYPGTFDPSGIERLARSVPAASRAGAAAIPVLRHSRPERGWTSTSLSLADGGLAKARFLSRTLFPPLEEVKANVAPGAEGAALAAAWARVLAGRAASGLRRLTGR